MGTSIRKLGEFVPGSGLSLKHVSPLASSRVAWHTRRQRVSFKVRLKVKLLRVTSDIFYYTIEFRDVYFTIGSMCIFLIGYLRTRTSQSFL